MRALSLGDPPFGEGGYDQSVELLRSYATLLNCDV